MPRTCPVCHASLRPRDAQCDACGTLIPIDESRRRRGDDDGMMFGGAFQSWGFIAAVIVYVPGVVAAFLFLVLVVIPNANRVNPFRFIQGIIMFSLFAPVPPATLVWMIVDSIHATWNWGNDPRGPETPWVNWWAGPARLGLLVLPPIGGCGLGFLAPPPDLVFWLTVGAIVGSVVGIAAAGVVSVVIKALT
jgi:hypothetical protein